MVSIAFWCYLIILAVYKTIKWTHANTKRAIDLRKDPTAWEQRKEEKRQRKEKNRQWKEKHKPKPGDTPRDPGYYTSDFTWRWKLGTIVVIIALLLLVVFVCSPYVFNKSPAQISEQCSPEPTD